MAKKKEQLDNIIMGDIVETDNAVKAVEATPPPQKVVISTNTGLRSNDLPVNNEISVEKEVVTTVRNTEDERELKGTKSFTENIVYKVIHH